MLFPFPFSSREAFMRQFFLPLLAILLSNQAMANLSTSLNRLVRPNGLSFTQTPQGNLIAHFAAAH